MRNLLLILLCVVFVGGCGNTLKNSWLDFRAYYNTYYNAQENFQTGLAKVEEQPVTIDPNEPVRIHPVPNQAGNSDFEKAIDKGARILRKFPDSQWTDDALLLIGKSYYYRQEFFPALQKFEELRKASTSPKMDQLAIIWKGWTQLDLKQHMNAVTYLESELNQYPAGWSTDKKAEIQALAGEHYAMMGNWEESADYLSAAVSGLDNKELLGRSFFLYGQVLERLGRYGEAFFAFSRVSENFPGFEYIFWARYKQADVARQEGNLDQAIAIYENLRKDDKNFQRRNELVFEIARTVEMKGEVEQAEKSYKQLLYGDQLQQLRSLKADIYYRLGRIYSDHYNDYPVAAAYFDSSSTISDAPEKIDETVDAESLANAFGRYTQLQSSITRADSLMRLGSLSDAQLDSALEKIRAQKIQAQLREQQSEFSNTFANRNTSDSDNQTSSSEYGFLNHRNSRLVNQSKTDFRVLWGNRPLIDNWRRMEAVRQSSVSNRTQERDNNNLAGEGANSITIDMNLDAIPRTAEEMNELRIEKVNAQYELGNLLFLNLNRPDSARFYYHQVLKSDEDSELRPRAMYSLHELFKAAGNQDSLQYWGNRILEEYPRSRFARRIRGISDGATSDSLETDSTKVLVQKFQGILNASEQMNKGAKLRKLALENRESELAPYIHYQSIESYIRDAAQKTDSMSVHVAPDDSVLVDSTQTVSAVMEKKLTFSGAHWDSVRIVVHEFDTTFSDAVQHKKVKKLKELLDQKEETKQQLPTCEDQGISLAVSPSMDEFLLTVEYPKELEGTSISGEVEYSFIVDGAGEVQSYELVSKRTGLGIEDTFEEAFKSLRFKSLQVKDVLIRCKVAFPIQH